MLKTTDKKTGKAIVLRRCASCDTVFKHSPLKQGQTVACPVCKGAHR